MSRLLLLLLALAPAALAQYPWYQTDTWQNGVSTADWQVNGMMPTASPNLLTSSGIAGFLLSNRSGVTAANPTGNQGYALRTTLRLTASGGYYILLLRASDNATNGLNNALAQAGNFYYIDVYNVVVANGHCTSNIRLMRHDANGFTALMDSPLSCDDALTPAGMALTATSHPNWIGMFWPNGAFSVVPTGADDFPGRPGVSVAYAPAANGFSKVEIGPWDQGNPNALARPVATLYPQAAEIQWTPTQDNAAGLGLSLYQLIRSSDGGATYSWFSNVPPDVTNFTDQTVAPSTTYRYYLLAIDFFNNRSMAGPFDLTTPPAGARNPRQIGLRPTGAYWGGQGEQIDTMSGNLNYTVPLLKAQTRAGAGYTVALSYNSQNWRQDAGGVWNYGRDVGYGYGWRLQAGSVLPVYQDYWSVHHWLFTDASGTEYRLDQHDTAGGADLWRSTEGVYVTYDAALRRLYFRDGSQWFMDALAAGVEPDNGTRYPTKMVDSNGNYIDLAYQQGRGALVPTSSARLNTITDTRGGNVCALACSYTFTYNNDATPHLTAVQSGVGDGNSYSLYYVNNSLADPFTGAGWGATVFLTGVTRTAGNNLLGHVFEYATAGTGLSGELSKATLPLGGVLRWSYGQSTFSGGRTLREVNARYLNSSATGSGPEWAYTWAHEPANTTGAIHTWTTVADVTANARRQYWFLQTAPSPGLVGALGIYVQYQHAPSVELRRVESTWATSASGNPYVSAAQTTLDQGQSYAKTSKVEQAIDTYGNVLTKREYDYNDLINPARTTAYTWLHGQNSVYATYGITNRLVSAVLSSPDRVFSTGPGTTTVPAQATYLVQNWYDQGDLAQTSPNLYNHYTWNPVRGNLTRTQGPDGVPTTMTYDDAGVVRSTARAGLSVQVTPDGSNSVPALITPNGNSDLQVSAQYNSFLGLTAESGPNGASASFSYDGLARQQSAVSAAGAATNYAYANTRPYQSTVTIASDGGGNGRWSRTTADGLGRPVKVEQGKADGTIYAVVESQYAPCGCTPMGKLKQQSLPYAPGPGVTPRWTVYSFDAIGRTVRVAPPGTTNPGNATVAVGDSTYVYQGSRVTATDIAGRQKTYATDGLGRLVQVTEPNAETINGQLVAHQTYYAYNGLDRMVGAYLPRMAPGGATYNQTRTWTYNGAGQLTSKTEPERGMTSYAYDSSGRMWQKTEANGSMFRTEWDSYGRVTKTYLAYLVGGSEATGGVVDYWYDNNGYDTAWFGAQPAGNAPDVARNYSANAKGRLAAMRYTNANGAYVYEMYSYSGAGQFTGKRLRVPRPDAATAVLPTTDFDGSFGYNSEGQRTFGAGGTVVYDGAGRPVGLSTALPQDTVSATYGPAGELLTFNYWTMSETRTYNERLQLTKLSLAGTSGNSQGDYTYDYQQTIQGMLVNTGQVAMSYDPRARLQTRYTYDALSRLSQSVLHSTQTTNPPADLSETYYYDGWGNKYLPGAGLPDPATNAVPIPSWTDANGQSMSTGYLSYDAYRRVVWAGAEQYAYAPTNLRVHRRFQQSGVSGYQDEYTYYDPQTGQRLGIYVWNNDYQSFLRARGFAWLGGKQAYASTDRVGSTVTEYRSDGPGGPVLEVGVYRPFGKAVPSAGNQPGGNTSAGYFKFGGLWADTSGLLYAENRYLQPDLGRWLTPDPYDGSGSAERPQSWNRYSYVENDPSNKTDSSGLFFENPDPYDPFYGPCFGDPLCTVGGGIDEGQLRPRSLYVNPNTLAVNLNDGQFINNQAFGSLLDQINSLGIGTYTADGFQQLVASGAITITPGTVAIGGGIAGWIIRITVVAASIEAAPIVVGAAVVAGVVGIAVYATRGNVKDTGVEEIIQDQYPKMDPCDALKLLMEQAKTLGDAALVKRIERTQKGYGCRNVEKRGR